MTGLEIKGRAQEGHVRIAILAGVLILLAPIARAGELTEAELMAAIFPHPTVSEAMHEAVLDAYGRAIHF